jgi:hypothetical protein
MVAGIPSKVAPVDHSYSNRELPAQIHDGGNQLISMAKL